MAALESTGLLLVNLGTPDAPTTKAVRKFLGEFLSDPRVIDIHPAARFLLLHLIILPFRSPRSAAAYQKVWTDRGSPLLANSRDLEVRLREELGNTPVELGMRYGNPGIAQAIQKLKERGARRLVVFPLYPHTAESSTASSVEAVKAAARGLFSDDALTFLPSFFDREGFLETFAARGREVLENFDADHVLFSYHGLPERHIRAADPSGSHCLVNEGCCDVYTDINRDCYRAQCIQTTAGISKRLGLSEGGYSTAFQSRLGRAAWITPRTENVVPEMAGRGIRKIAVFCPAFVADCLETLEEIEIRVAESFVDAGGEELRLVPSLNADPAWVKTLAAWFEELSS